MQDTLYLLLSIYACFAVTKLVLCAVNLPTAIGVMSRLSGLPRGKVNTRYVFTIPLFGIAMIVFGWVFIMKREGLAFFDIYSNKAVMRDCVRAYKGMHN